MSSVTAQLHYVFDAKKKKKNIASPEMNDAPFRLSLLTVICIANEGHQKEEKNQKMW